MNLKARLGEFSICMNKTEVKQTVQTFAGSYYTYIICKQDKRTTPIYVGKGRGYRCLEHTGEGEKFEFQDDLIWFLRPAKSDRFARDLETEIISYFGKISDGGTLVNEKLRGGLSRACVVTTAMFISRAKSAHGDKYDYSKSVYKSAKTPVEIVCPKHGSFWQQADNHTQGKGCNLCANDLRATLFSSNTERFIKEAKQAHGDKYSYSKTEYSNRDTKVEILCKIHGSFWQSPEAHKRGNGCPKCKGLCDTPQFILEARRVHRLRYDYSKSVYINAGTKVEILCKEHGSFWQIPGSHVRGSGCPVCGLRRS